MGRSKRLRHAPRRRKHAERKLSASAKLVAVGSAFAALGGAGMPWAAHANEDPTRAESGEADPAAQIQEAERAPLADYDRWSPSIAFQMGLLRQQAIGRVVSNVRPPGAVGTVLYGDNLLLDYTFGASVDLMAPAISQAFGRPQPFFHVDLMHTLGLEVDVVREASPDGFSFPNIFASDTTIPATAVGGQGQKTEAQFKSPAVAAGLGMSFSFEAFDETFRVRPSIQYFFQQVEVTGTLLAAEGQRVISGGVMTEDFAFTTLTAKSSKSIHAIGGGVEIEIDFAEALGGTFSLGAGVHVYHLQGSRGFALSGVDGTSTASFSATLDPLIYRGGFSTRYRFNGWGGR